MRLTDAYYRAETRPKWVPTETLHPRQPEASQQQDVQAQGLLADTKTGSCPSGGCNSVTCVIHELKIGLRGREGTSSNTFTLSNLTVQSREVTAHSKLKPPS